MLEEELGRRERVEPADGQACVVVVSAGPTKPSRVGLHSSITSSCLATASPKCSMSSARRAASSDIVGSQLEVIGGVEKSEDMKTRRTLDALK